MSVIWVNIIIFGILIFYLSGFLVIIGLLISKIIERKKERIVEREKLKDDEGY